jgi:hypothetical protein
MCGGGTWPSFFPLRCRVGSVGVRGGRSGRRLSADYFVFGCRVGGVGVRGRCLGRFHLFFPRRDPVGPCRMLAGCPRVVAYREVIGGLSHL